MSLARPLRPSLLSSSSSTPTLTPRHHPQSLPTQQIRHATLIKRPLRPYTFTQLVTLSDGSTYTHRTTSPAPLYKSTKDTRNTPMWNPSSQKLLSVEADEAGRLRRFREKFGRGWDATGGAGKDKPLPDGEAVESRAEDTQAEVREEEDNLMDLISGFGREAEARGEAAGVRQGKGRSGKGKGGER